MLPELREAVRTVSADIVFLQEVLGEHEMLARRHATRWPDEPHYEFLAHSIWRDYAYGCNAVYPNGHHGNALMSKYSIDRHRNVDVSIENTEKRGLLHCEIPLPLNGPTVHAICVHLGLREAHRKQQMNLLCDLVSGIPSHEPIVVAGDFNDWRGRSQEVMYACGLKDVFVEQYGFAPKTFPAVFPMLRLDRIYVRGVAQSTPFHLPNRPWAHLSDHAPLAAEVVF